MDYNAHNYEALLNTCFEIEGLISLMRMREEESPEEVYALLKEKVAAVAAELGVVVATEPVAVAEEAQQQEADQQAVATAVEFEEASDADIAEPEPAPVVAPDPAPVVAPAPEPVVETVDVHTEIPVVTDDIPVVVLDDDDDDEAEEARPVVFDDAHVVNPPTPAPTPAPAASLFDELSASDDTERRDRHIARERSSGDLLSTLSRNDLIRFRRELFGNSPIVFTDTIHMLGAMNSYAEAEEYLYGDLHWNPDDEDVRDFMAILRNHFSNR